MRGLFDLSLQTDSNYVIISIKNKLNNFDKKEGFLKFI